jgi:hypothetical protein
MGNNIKGTKDSFAGVGPGGGSWKSTVNPIASITGKGEIRVPEPVWDFFTKGLTPGTEEYDNAGRWAGIVSNAGGAAILGAALLGGYRVGKGIYKDLTGAGRGVAEDADNRLSTTFTPEGSVFHKKGALIKEANPKDDKIVVGPGPIAQKFVQTALPVGAFILASAVGYTGADRLMDKSYANSLDEQIADEQQRFNKLVVQRGRGAKKQYKTAALNKEAGGWGSDAWAKFKDFVKPATDVAGDAVTAGISSYGILCAALLGSAALMTHTAYSANNKNNLNFDAHKKALDAHVLNRASNTPLTHANVAASPMLKAIDKGFDEKNVPIRDKPQVMTQTQRRAILDMAKGAEDLF